MTKKEQVESLYNQFIEYTETAEQHEFPYLAQVNFYIEMGYNNLKEHWDEKHADIFIRSVTDLLVKLYGTDRQIRFSSGDKETKIH